MPTYMTSKAFTTGAWVQFDLTKVPKGMARCTIIPKTLGVAVAISTAQPTHGVTGSDPIFYIDIAAISQFDADPCMIWIYGGASNFTSLIAST